MIISVDLAKHSSFTNLEDYKSTASQQIGLWLEGKTGSPGENPLKLSPHVTVGQEIESVWGVRISLISRWLDKWLQKTCPMILLEIHVKEIDLYFLTRIYHGPCTQEKQAPFSTP